MMTPHSSVPALTVATGTKASSRAQLRQDWSLLTGACTICRLDLVAGPGFLEDPAARVEGANPKDLGWLMECERLRGPLPSDLSPTHPAEADDPAWAAQASANIDSPAQESSGQCPVMTDATAAAGPSATQFVAGQATGRTSVAGFFESLRLPLQRL